eukprot:gb/GFBE01033307.1/.p1 GENE.gb/GFBE01033307.1/~~gb/GFBE01033307.1/.p1  ORF type:complete len:266 (+),score=40.84 gb/GFBE01033307.1/:1-798(+)
MEVTLSIKGFGARTRCKLVIDNPNLQLSTLAHADAILQAYMVRMEHQPSHPNEMEELTQKRNIISKMQKRSIKESKGRGSLAVLPSIISAGAVQESLRGHEISQSPETLKHRETAQVVEEEDEEEKPDHGMPSSPLGQMPCSPKSSEGADTDGQLSGEVSPRSVHGNAVEGIEGCAKDDGNGVSGTSTNRQQSDRQESGSGSQHVSASRSASPTRLQPVAPLSCAESSDLAQATGVMASLQPSPPAASKQPKRSFLTWLRHSKAS